MAPPAGTLRVGRYFLALVAILAVLYAHRVLARRAAHAEARPRPRRRHPGHLHGEERPTARRRRVAHGAGEADHEDRVNGTGVTGADGRDPGQRPARHLDPRQGTETDVAKLGAAADPELPGLVAPAGRSPACRPSTGARLGAPPSATRQPAPAHQRRRDSVAERVGRRPTTSAGPAASDGDRSQPRPPADDAARRQPRPRPAATASTSRPRRRRAGHRTPTRLRRPRPRRRAAQQGPSPIARKVLPKLHHPARPRPHYAQADHAQQTAAQSAALANFDCSVASRAGHADADTTSRVTRRHGRRSPTCSAR